jgi:hypothetical protein
VETAAGQITLADKAVVVDFVTEKQKSRSVALFDEVSGPVIHILLAESAVAVHAREAFALVVLVSALVLQWVNDCDDLLQRRVLVPDGVV